MIVVMSEIYDEGLLPSHVNHAAEGDTGAAAETSVPLPDAHRWWPYLTARSKERLDSGDGEVVPDDVRVEIERILGVRLAAEAHLSDADRRFIRTQQEEVD